MKFIWGVCAGDGWDLLIRKIIKVGRRAEVEMCWIWGVLIIRYRLRGQIAFFDERKQCFGVCGRSMGYVCFLGIQNGSVLINVIESQQNNNCAG